MTIHAVVLLAIGLACSLGLASPRSDTSREFFKGKIVGAYFGSVGESQPPHAFLQFLLCEDYSTKLGVPGTTVMTGATSRAVKPADFEAANYATLMQSLLPNGVRFGQDCLVEGKRTDDSKTIVSVVPYDDAARRAFLTANMPAILDAQESRLERGRVHVRIYKEAIAKVEPNRAARLSHLRVDAHLLQGERDRVRAVEHRIDAMREAMSEEQRAKADVIVASAHAVVAALDEQEKALLEAIAPDSVGLPPSTPDSESEDHSLQFFKGRIVAVHTPPDYGEPCPLELEFFWVENYGSAGSQVPPDRALVSGSIGDDAMLAKLTVDNYDDTMRSRMPNGLRLGDECLVVLESNDGETKVTSIERFDDEARRRFLTRHFDAIFNDHAWIFGHAAEWQRKAKASTIDRTRAALASAAQEPDQEKSRKIRNEALDRLRSTIRATDRLHQSIGIGVQGLERLREVATDAQRRKIDGAIEPAPQLLKQYEALKANLEAFLAECEG